MVCLCAKRKVGEFSVFTVYVFSVLLRVSPSAPVCRPFPVVSRVRPFPPVCHPTCPCFPRRSSPFVLRLPHQPIPLRDMSIQEPVSEVVTCGGFPGRCFPGAPFPCFLPLPFRRAHFRTRIPSPVIISRVVAVTVDAYRLLIVITGDRHYYYFTWRLDYELENVE